MRKANKTVISFAVVLIAGLNLVVPAFAQDPFTAIAVGGLSGASGAGLFGSMAGMSGIDIAWSSGGSDPMDAMWNVINPDHVYFSGQKHEATGTGEDIYDYIDVDIGDWLQAQSDFIVNFAQTHNVTDNSSGIVVANYEYNGIPITNNSFGTLYSRVINSVSLDIPVGEVRVVPFPDGYYVCTITSRDSVSRINFKKELFIGGSLVSTANVTTFPSRQPVGVYYNCGTSGGQVSVSLQDSAGILGVANQIPGAIASKSSNIPWTSTTVNTSVFDGWESAKVKIPHSESQLSSGWTLSDFLNELDRIWTGAGEDNIIIEEGGDIPPVPPVPVPSTPLGEVPFDDWIDLWGQGIYEQLENQSDTLDLIGSNGEDQIEELESIDSNLGELNQTAESIDTNIGIGNGILGGIRSLAQSAVNSLEGIAEHVGELVEEIVEGTETLIAGILNQIPQAFGVIFGPIKQASSIWHYVVEWIQSIGAPFQFIWSMASGTSYYIILPVYASLAAAVVLAFYKRFGK